MQNNESENSHEESIDLSELRVQKFAGASGAPEREVFMPPRAVVRVPGEPKEEVVDKRPRAHFSLEALERSHAALSAGLSKELPYERARSVEVVQGTVEFSVQFARENEVSDAIIHRQLQKVQLQAPSNYERHGKQYVPTYSGQSIVDALGCFKNRGMVYDAAARLARNKHLEPESWENLDEEAWYEFPLSHSFHVPAPLSDDDVMTISTAEALCYRLPKAVVLAAHRNQTIRKLHEGRWYKKMSAKELALELPYTPQTIGKYLRQLEGDVLIMHPKFPKYYRLAGA